MRGEGVGKRKLSGFINVDKMLKWIGNTVLMWLFKAALVFGTTGGDEDSLKVAAIFAAPFISEKYDVDHNVTYIGVIPDLLKKITMNNERLQFSYFPDMESKTEEDNNRTWKWVKDAVRQEKAHIGVGPLPKISKGHPKKLHYIKHFAEHRGWTVLLKRPLVPVRDIFAQACALLHPFRIEVWIAVIACFSLTCVLLAIINLVDPYEYRQLYQRDKIPKYESQNLSPFGSLLFVVSTLLWQGYERAPRSISARVLVIFWMTFVAFTLLSYTASLTNFLNHSSHEKARKFRTPDVPIYDPAELANDGHGLTYGTIETWPIIEYLEEHDNETIRSFGAKLKASSDNVPDLRSGLAKIRENDPKYALLVDRVVAETLIKQNCDLMAVGRIEPSHIKGYSIIIAASPTPPLDASVTGFKTALLELLESGSFRHIWKKWTHEPSRCPHGHVILAKSVASGVTSYDAISLYQFIGPLAIMGLGIVLAVIVCGAEVLVFFITSKVKTVNITGPSLAVEEEHRLHDECIDEDLTLK